LGVAYNNLGDSQKSIDYFLNALQIMEQINDKNGIAVSYRNLGQANFYLDNFDKALEYFQKALKLQEEIGNEKDISQALIMIGNVKAKTAIYDEALDYYFKAMAIKEEINDKHGISQIYNNLGNIYLDTGYHDRALEYRLKALQIDRELDDKWEIANATYNIAEQYLKNKEPEKAYPYILESQKLAEDLDNKGLIRDNLHNLSLYYELVEDYQKALKYQRDYSEITKSLFSEELSEKITEMQIKYETEKLEEAVAERTQELQQKVYELEQTEKSLRKSEQRLDLAVTGTGLGLWTWDIQTDGFKYTPQWTKMLGYSHGEIEPKFSSYKNLVHPDDEHKMMEMLNAHLEGKTPIYEAEIRMHTKSGEWKWILSTGKVFERDNDGRPLRMTGLHRDITERVQAEETLRQRTAQLEALRLVGLKLTAELDLDSLLNSIASQAIELLGGAAGGLDLYQPDQDVLKWTAFIGLDSVPSEIVLRRGEGLSGKVWSGAWWACRSAGATSSWASWKLWPSRLVPSPRPTPNC
jgi:PAS domain S-box-containing protein